MTRLAAANSILYVESPGLRSFRLASAVDLPRLALRFRRWLGGLSRPLPNLWVLSPAGVPFLRRGVVERWNTRIFIRQVRRAARRLGFRSPIVWSFLPTMASAAAALDPRLIVYHCVDDYAANPGADAASVERAERAMLSAADVVFTISRPLYEAKRGMNPNTHYAPNVADVSVFRPDVAPCDAVARLRSRPLIGFVGNICRYKVDIELLERAARERPDWNWVLVGPVGLGDPETDVRALRALPNVFFLGEVVRDEVPRYVAGMDVCVIPFRVNSSTTHAFPLKFHEFMAMGKPVVATDLPPLQDFRSSFYPVTKHEEFVPAIARALGESPSLARQRILLAQENSWERRMEQICDVVGHALASPGKISERDTR